MSDRESRQRDRRRRRIRSQIISYTASAVLFIAVVAGCTFGIRFAVNAVEDRKAAKQESIQAALEESRAAESAQAEAAVAALLESAGSEEPSAEYTKEDALNEMVEDSVAGMTLEQKVAGLFMITPEQLTGIGQVIQAGDSTREALGKWPVGGIIYFKSNIQSEEQLTEMLENTASYSSFPLFLAVDEEGGSVARVAEALQLDNVPSMSEIGATGDPQEAYRANETIGKYLSSYGFNVDFAPIADVLTNTDNTVISKRAFSSDAQTAAKMVAEAVKGLQSTGMSACVKHFPGHGDTAGDSHTGAAVTERTREEIEAEELLPFKSGIEAGVDMVMVGHISAPSLTNGDKTPATLSEDIITGVLRKQLGYNGIIITDAMNMAAVTDNYEADVAAVTSLRAGVDMILMPDDFEQAYEGVIKAVREGTISEERIDESLKRIYRVKLRDKAL